jgi:hypothetical protein
MKMDQSVGKLISTQKISEMMRKEREQQLEVNQKYGRFKRSASLSNYHSQKVKMNHLTDIYRSLTA